MSPFDIIVIVYVIGFLFRWRQVPLRIRWTEMLLAFGTLLAFWGLYFGFRTAAQSSNPQASELVSNLAIFDWFFLITFAGACVLVYQRLQMLHLSRVASGEPW